MKTWPSLPAHRSKVVKVRKDHECFLSSWSKIKKGSEALAVKIMPNSATGQLWDLTSPWTTYFCGECPLCKSKWAQDPESDEDDYPKESQ